MNADLKQTPEDVIFNNAYTASGTFDVDTIINPRKSLTGRDLKGGEFVFALRYGTYQVQSTRNTADGNIPFRPLTFNQDQIGQGFWGERRRLPRKNRPPLSSETPPR